MRLFHYLFGRLDLRYGLMVVVLVGVGASACDFTEYLQPTSAGLAVCSDYAPSPDTMANVERAEDQIRRVLASTPTCTAVETSSGCKLISLQTAPSQLLWQDADPRAVVMIIGGHRDCNLMRDPSEQRYRHRIIARYSAAVGGDYERCENVLEMPAALASILYDTPGAYQYVPAKGFSQGLSNLVNEKFGSLMPSTYDHGNVPLQVVAEQTPQATFVLVESPGVPNGDGFCVADERYLEEFQLRVAETLEKIVREHGVRFVLYPEGSTRRTTQQYHQYLCGDEPDAEHKVDRIFAQDGVWLRRLSQMDGVTFVQSSAYIYEGEAHSAFAIDCNAAGAPNRVRVAHYDSPLAETEIVGPWAADMAQRDGIPEWYRGGDACIDVYINSGLFPPPEGSISGQPGIFPAESTTSLGLEVGPYAMMSSSYAAPIAVSYLIHVAMAGGSLSPAETLREITSDGRNKFHDPLRAEKMESFRLRKAWYQDVRRCHP